MTSSPAGVYCDLSPQLACRVAGIQPWSLPGDDLRRGYESFTDSSCSADKNPGGRIPRLWANGANHDMGRPAMTTSNRMPHVVNARRKALRAVLSALAGGGLTAARHVRAGQPSRPGRGEAGSATTAAETTTQPATETPAASTTTTETTSTPTTTATTPAASADRRPCPRPRRRRRRRPKSRRSFCSARRRSPPPLAPRASPRRKPPRPRPAGSERRQHVAASPQTIASAGALARPAGLLAVIGRGAELLPDPAVPASDLQGRRRAVRGAVADPRRDQRNRDRLRHRPVGVRARAPWAGCSSCRPPGCSTGSTP